MDGKRLANVERGRNYSMMMSYINIARFVAYQRSELINATLCNTIQKDRKPWAWGKGH